MDRKFCIKNLKRTRCILFVLCAFIFFNQYLIVLAKKIICVTNRNREKSLLVCRNKTNDETSSCSGKSVYIQHLPHRFNLDIVKDCASILKWKDMCMFVSNFGMGAGASNADNILQNTSWYATDQFLLEVIFHSKMNRYKCLTNNSASATAIFVPFYAGLDISRYVLDGSNNDRDGNSVELAKWISKTPEWKRMNGRDHFSVLGRIAIDFRRTSEDKWGNQLLVLPEFNNMTLVGIESDTESPNLFAIPYPTYFHPSTDSEVFEWQQKVFKSNRQYLYAFVGCPRPNQTTSIRNIIIEQCISSGRMCTLLDCDSNDCNNPVNVMKMFQNSVFCLQPAGDSYTRRSTFDSILAGCIPVFFHLSSAYTQYMWYLPNNYTRYSVLIPEKALTNKTANIENILKAIPKNEAQAMKKEVINLIPKIVYADPRSHLDKLEDAFNIAVSKVLKRIKSITREHFD